MTCLYATCFNFSMWNIVFGLRFNFHTLLTYAIPTNSLHCLYLPIICFGYFCGLASHDAWLHLSPRVNFILCICDSNLFVVYIAIRVHTVFLVLTTLFVVVFDMIMIGSFAYIANTLWSSFDMIMIWSICFSDVLTEIKHCLNFYS